MANRLQRSVLPDAGTGGVVVGRSGFIGNASSWLLAAALTLAPISWLPGMPHQFLSYSKLALVGLASLTILGSVLLTRRRPTPNGLLGPAGFCGLLVLWLPGLAKANAGDAIQFIVSLCVGSLVFWCSYCLARDGDAIWRIFCRVYWSSVGLVGLSLIGIQAWRNVGPGNAYYGFGQSYASWSVALALLLPLAGLASTSPESSAECAPSRMGRSGVFRVFSALGGVVLASAQFLSTGRSGILLSLLILVACAGLCLWRSFQGRNVLVGFLLVLLIGTVIGCRDGSCRGWLQFSGLDLAETWDEPLVAVCAINEFSTDRVAGIDRGMEVVVQAPLYGHGLKQFGPLFRAEVNEIPEMNEIHNLWIRWAVYTGVLAPTLMLTMAALLVQAGWRSSGREDMAVNVRRNCWILFGIILLGLLASLWEPSVPFENRSMLIWWAAAGALVGLDPRVRDKRKQDGGNTPGERSQSSASVVTRIAGQPGR